MPVSKPVKVLFYVFPLFLFVHLAYGLIVREPYPSFMMPGFSRIDNQNETYSLVDRSVSIRYANGSNSDMDLLDLDATISKIALSRLIDLAFFKEEQQKVENSAQKKYYGMIKSFVGSENYKKYVTDIRQPEMVERDIERFESWFYKKVTDISSDPVDLITIVRIKETRNFKTGEILKKEIIDSRVLEK